MRVAFDVRAALGAYPGTKYHCTRLAHWLPKVAPQHQFEGVYLRSLRHPPNPADLRFVGLPTRASWLPSVVAHHFWNRSYEWTPEWFGRRYDVYVQTDCGLPPLMKGPKYAAFIHDLTFVQHPEFFEKPQHFVDLLWLAVRRAAVILVVSETTRRHLLEFTRMDENRVRLILNGCDSLPVASDQEVAEVRRRYDHTYPYFVATGEIHRKKNLPRLVQAYFALLERGVDAPDLVLIGRAGNGSEELERVLAGHPQRHRVDLLGYLPEKELYALLRGAEALLYPSLWEGFGLPPLQAMGLDVPVLAARAGSIPEVVGEAALLVDPLNVEEMTDGMARLLEDSSFRQSLVEAGRLQATRFNWEHSARQLASVLESL